jgi:tetratricopeptide (TPR) repeat protein
MNVKKMITSLVILVLVSGMAAVLNAQGRNLPRLGYYSLEGDLYYLARKQTIEEKFADAAKTYEELVLRQPFKLTPRFLLAITYYRMGNFQKAAKTCEYMERCFPFDFKRMSRSFFKNMYYSQFYYILGTAYSSLERYPDAVNAFQKILKSHNYKVPNTTRDEINCLLPLNSKSFYALVHYQLGTTYMSMGDKDAALKQYKKLKKLDLEKSEELYNLIHRKESVI